jgi:hypothetical protein
MAFFQIKYVSNFGILFLGKALSANFKGNADRDILNSISFPFIKSIHTFEKKTVQNFNSPEGP